MKLDPYQTPYIKINSSWSKNLNVRPKTPRRKQGNFHNIGLDNDFLEFDTKNTGNKNKNRQVELYQTKKLPHCKGNHKQNEKTTYGMGENIFKQCL